jgi:hypothetical protein
MNLWEDIIAGALELLGRLGCSLDELIDQTKVLLEQP